MTTIQERYKRVYEVLVSTFASMSEEDKNTVRKEGINLRWLRNEARLWSDFVEDESMVIDDCNQDPAHPDQLSDSVWGSFKLCHLGWYTHNE